MGPQADWSVVDALMLKTLAAAQDPSRSREGRAIPACPVIGGAPRWRHQRQDGRLAFAEKQQAIIPLMTGHRIVAMSLMYTGALAQSRAHYDKAIGLYDPVKHRPLVARFNQDARVATLCHRSMALWLLGYLDAALADANQSLSEAREVGHAVTLMYALSQTIHPCVLLGEYGTANVIGDELVALAEEKGSLFWKAVGMTNRGWSRAMTSSPSEATHELTVGLAVYRSTGSTNSMPIFLSALAKGHFVLQQFDEAWQCLNEAMTIIEKTKEVLYEAEVNRLADEIALLSRGTASAGPYFERALAVARIQQAKSWELRAAMSIARLWRDQGKRDEARELLAPVGESAEAWRAVLDDLIKRGLRRPEFLIVDGAPGLEKAIAAVWDGVPVQRCTVHKHRNLLASAPERLHEEIGADYNDMIYAATPEEIEARRKAFIRKWRLKHRAVADSLEEAGDRLFTFTRLPPSQWRSARTTNAIERLHEEFKRRIKTQTVLPSADTAAMLFWALLASGQINMRKVEGWHTLAANLIGQPIDLAA
jgi:tetratricopeptide (TPR) repeat protein